MAKGKAFVMDGRKYYPCCSFERNQHKLDYWSTYYFNKYDDTGDDKYYDLWQTWSNLFCMSQYSTMADGIMYFPYPEYNIVKEGIVAYDLKH